MVLLALLIAGGFAACLGFAGRLLLRRAGEPPGRASLFGVAAALLALAGMVIFAFDELVYGVSENGPQYYAFSAYIRYRHTLDGPGGLVFLVVYAVVPAVLATAAVLGGRRRAELGMALGLTALAAPALPLIVASALPRAEYGKDPVLHVAEGSWPPSVGQRSPTPCFVYSVERPEPQYGKAPPTLCLRLKPTAEVTRLATGDGEDTNVHDIANRLNRDGVKPYDVPSSVGLRGIDIELAWWRGRNEPEPVQKPRQPGELTEAELTYAQQMWEESHRRVVEPGPSSGCKAHRVPGGQHELGPPAPRVHVQRRGSTVGVRYRFRRLPRSDSCRPYAVVVEVQAIPPDHVGYASILSRARVKAWRGQLTVNFMYWDEQPNRVAVYAVSLAHRRSREVTAPL